MAGTVAAVVVAGGRGFVDELHPIHPTLVTPEQRAGTPSALLTSVEQQLGPGPSARFTYLITRPPTHQRKPVPSGTGFLFSPSQPFPPRKLSIFGRTPLTER
jgi:hypothetical protein